MRSISVLIAAVTIVSSFIKTGCVKEPNPSSSKSIHGLWIGTYTINGQTTNTDTYYSFIIKPGGSLVVEGRFLNQQQFASGTWTLSGQTLSCVYSYVYAASGHVGTTQSATATWDNSGKLTSGTWMNTSPANGTTGTFTLTKVE